MAKKAEQNKLRNKDGVLLEQTSIYDDSLLPSSDELLRLKQIDPNIVQWLMDRATKEQEARIKYNDDKIDLTRQSVNKAHSRSVIGMIFIFLVIVIGFALSAWFVYLDKDLGASIFGGSTFVALIIALLRIKK